MAIIEASTRGNRHNDLSRDSFMRVVDALVDSPGLTRAELSARAGLTRSPVGMALAALDERGFLVQRVEPEHPGAERGMGRPPLRIQLAGDAGHSIALEVGANALHGGIFELGGRALHRCHGVLPDGAGPLESLDVATDVVLELISVSGVDHETVTGIGVGVPGALDSSAVLVGDDTDAEWLGFDLAAALAQRTALPAQLENVANLGALGEYRFGAGRGCDDMLYLRLSDTIGVGLVIGGRLHRGVSGVAGELGHVSVGVDGPLCRCGNRGCVEARAGGQAILGDVRSMVDAGGIVDVVRAATEGDRWARRAIADAATIVGEGLAAAVGLLNPGRIVVGGELAAAGPLVMEPLAAAISRRAFPAAASAAQLVPGELDSAAGLLGGSTLHLAQLAPSLAQRLAL